MNKSKLKSYAPAARRDFIQAVTDRAHFYGLSEKDIIPVEVSGDVAIIGGRPFPRAVAAQRKKLEERVKREGFNQVMEAVAYTWFNRFLALRYMELHSYLEHGFRVLSNTGSSKVPEILDHAAQLDLPGLNKNKVVELKLDGSKDAELYRLLLVAQCNALHAAMPFLFEKIEDETELLLPDNLLHSDSLIRKLVTEIEEEDWQEVEIIGWLYQYYISEKKDQVIGKVVKSEDIPAATQLFTPNWIVKYMVQNSLGRQWLATYPASPLKSKMEYYIEPAAQTAEVNAQLAAITPDSLDPEKLTLLDPACGSGHILVEAYDVFKDIYLERGYSNRDFPRLILEKNLYGLDIDDRAAQMAGFALLMKARKDDRRILRSDNPVKLNIMAIQESGNLSVKSNDWGENYGTIQELVETFKGGKTFGSLILISAKLATKLQSLEHIVKQAIARGDLYVMQTAKDILPLIEQAKILSGKYNCVVANPPYMGSKGMNPTLKEFAKNHFSDSKSDLFAMFIERAFGWCNANGFNAMVTMQSWMFLSSLEQLRKFLLREKTLTCLVHMGNGVMGIAFGTVATIFQNWHTAKYIGLFASIDSSDLNSQSIPHKFPAENKPLNSATSDDFLIIPGHPIAYWISNNVRKLFSDRPSLGDYFFSEGPCKTGNDALYMRSFWELEILKVGPERAWCICSKGGGYQKYYGNLDNAIAWKESNRKHYRSDKIARISPEYVWNLRGITWTIVTSKPETSFRELPAGIKFNSVSPTIFLKEYSDELFLQHLALLNSKPADYILRCLNPTLAMNVENVLSLPVPVIPPKAIDNINFLLSITISNCNDYETSLGFETSPFIKLKSNSGLKNSWVNWDKFNSEQWQKVMCLETENNKLFIDAYGLQNEVTPDIPESQITLSRASLVEDVKYFISYAIGCMMGRYSLDQTGLVYANSTNFGFDSTKYQKFPADDDGIVPVMDMGWFPDDAASRFEEFLRVAWSPETLEENLKFVADSLAPKGGETPRETIRRYVSTLFYKDHLQTYKKRPIYWLFSSGKQRAFECLVYLHRYNESTLSRMRNEYVTPLQGKFSAQVDYLSNEVNAASSTAERNRLQKQLDTLRKKQVELASFDDLLRHYADQRISLDLDDGVKVNYGKFGNLLSDVKAITGGGE